MSESEKCQFNNVNGTPTEGYLGCKKNFNGVLIIMREPNSDGEEAKSFWFKDVVNDKCTGKRYFNFFTECTKRLKPCQKELKNCAYINLHPEYGESSLSRYYKIMIRIMQGKTPVANKTKINGTVCSQDEICKAKSDINKRWALINKLQPSFIITCGDIANGLKVKSGNVCNINEYSFKINNMDCTVYSVYHPSCPSATKHLDDVFN